MLKINQLHEALPKLLDYLEKLDEIYNCNSGKLNLLESFEANY